MRAAASRLPGGVAGDHRAPRGAADFRRGDDRLPRGVRRRATALRDPSGPDHLGQGDRRRAAGGSLRRAQGHHEHRGAVGAGLPGRDAIRKPAGGGRRPSHAAPSEGAPRGLRPARNARRGTVRRGAGWGHGEPGWLHVHVLLHRGPGHGLRISQALRHRAVRQVLPRHAGPRNLPRPLAVRGCISLRGAFRRGHPEDRGRRARSLLA
jgi:hypothetical protein